MTRTGPTIAAALAGLVLASVGIAQAAESGAARCTPISPQQVAALFDRWNAALATKDPDAVVKDYTTDAVLLPTLETGPLVGRDAIRGYFVDFLKKNPTGVIDKRIIRIGCNMAFDVGTYTFTVNGQQPGSRVQVPARYTYIYEPVGGQWLIVQHHSSKQPDGGH